MLAARTANPCLARKATRSAVRAAPASRRAVVVRAGTPYPSDWIKKDPLVPVLGFLGWTIPSNIPVSAFGGQSLFGLFTASIGENLAKFPQGPSIDDPFWLYLLTWHMGLFACIFWGQIGVQARKQGYL
ncbi:photosystem I reaction center subunit O [Scenedesmus sp. NREL 46B-D3]|nr:photosystem I reaction center subunit O [Scenedesmus sp. NREL 46B-D3]